MSSNSDDEAVDLSASETESDEDEESDNENNSNDDVESTIKTKTAEDLLREKIEERYKERNGKQLFIRFPARLPNEEKDFQKQVFALSPLIVKAHKPRQKHARFCLIDFGSKEDRDMAMKTIRASVKNDTAFKGIVVLIPRTEKEGFVEELIKKKLQNVEAKKAKAKLKRAAKQSKITQHFTPTIVVSNLPVNVSILEIRNLFPNAVDIQLKTRSGKKPIRSSMAVITLPSTMEARAETKKNVSLGGTRLSIHFDRRKAKLPPAADKTDKTTKKKTILKKIKPTAQSKNKKKKIKQN